MVGVVVLVRAFLTLQTCLKLQIIEANENNYFYTKLDTQPAMQIYIALYSNRRSEDITIIYQLYLQYTVDFGNKYFFNKNN